MSFPFFLTFHILWCKIMWSTNSSLCSSILIGLSESAYFMLIRGCFELNLNYCPENKMICTFSEKDKIGIFFSKAGKYFLESIVFVFFDIRPERNILWNILKKAKNFSIVQNLNISVTQQIKEFTYTAFEIRSVASM